jgi:hypothetical protein
MPSFLREGLLFPSSSSVTALIYKPKKKVFALYTSYQKEIYLSIVLWHCIIGEMGKLSVRSLHQKGCRWETPRRYAARSWFFCMLAGKRLLGPFPCQHTTTKASIGLPRQSVIQRRAKRAKLLLSTANWPLPTITHTAGCAHESHLALDFKRLTGLTPRYSR